MEFRKINDINIDESRIKDIARKFSVTESVAELLLLRNFTTDEQIDKFLNPSLKDLHNPFLFNNMKAVVDKINNAMLNKKRILIFGDYDVDGITASYILIDYFKSIGYDVDAFLPNRYVDGYGLTMETANNDMSNIQVETEEVTEYDIVCPYCGGGITFATPTEDFESNDDVDYTTYTGYKD